jgi:hypothetical protein
MDNGVRRGISIFYFPVRFADSARISFVYIGRIDRTNERKTVGVCKKGICQFAFFRNGLFGGFHNAGSVGDSGFGFFERLHVDNIQDSRSADNCFGYSFYRALQNQMA